MQPISIYLKNPRAFFIGLLKKCNAIFSDKLYLELMFLLEMKQKLNLQNPHTFQEKLQWLKLYDRKNIYTSMVDKILAKVYAANILGNEYIIPTLGVWDNFDEIDFDSLPKQFVLKTNNGGGNNGVVICRDKTHFNYEMAKKKLSQSLKSNIYNVYKEWPYKNIKPHIFAEQYMVDNSIINNGGLTDYKFTCFNGQVDNVMVCVDRHLNDTKFYFFDKDWNLLRLNVRGLKASSDFSLPKPPCIDEMFRIAAKLSVGIPFLRVDLYCINGKVYFGETTFYPQSGFDHNLLYATDELWGSNIDLNIVKS